MNNTSLNTSCKQLKSFTMALVTICGSLFSYGALATCTINGPVDRLFTEIRSSDGSSGWDIKIDGSAPLNTFMIYMSLSTPEPESIITCDTNRIEFSRGTDYPYISTINNMGIYDTGIPGIGMTIYSYNSIGGNVPQSNSVNTPWIIQQNSTYLISLIKIGDITADGQIPAGPVILRSTIPDHGNLNVLNVRLARPLNVTILRPTCAVNRPHFTVDLGEVSVTDFNASGRTQPKDSSIALTCTGGTSTTNVHVTLTDANNPGNTSNQLSLSPDSDAQGIALELTNRYGLVNFGPDLAGIGNPGQWFDGAAGVGNYSIPLTVNYVRLPGPIKAGTANAGVTYTLNYD